MGITVMDILRIALSLFLLMYFTPDAEALSKPIPRQTSFPLDLFFETSAPRIPAFLDTSSCNGFRFERCCYCDNDNCLLYRRCCIDKFWQGDNSTNSQSHLDIYIEELAEMTANKTDKKLYCLPFLPGLRSGFGHFLNQEMFMVGECPSDTTSPSAVVENCLRPDQSFEWLVRYLPVLGKDLYLYKNIFCAMCHGITDFEFISLTIICQLYNQSASNYTNLFEIASQCYSYLPVYLTKGSSLVSSSRCKSSLETNFNREHTSRDSLLCDLYMSPVYDENDVWYKNPHCLWEKRGRQVNYSQSKCDWKIPINLSIEGLSLAGQVFTLTFGRESTMTVFPHVIANSSRHQHKIKCANNSVYDFFHGRCVLVFCQAGFLPTGRTCLDARPPSIDTRLRTNKTITNELLNCLVGNQTSHFLLYIDAFNVTNFNLTHDNTSVISFLRLEGTNFALDTFTFTGKYTFVVSLLHRSSIDVYPLTDYNTLLGRMRSSHARSITKALVTSSSRYTDSVVYGVDVSRSFQDGSICYNRTIYTNAADILVNVTSSCGIWIDGKVGENNLNKEAVYWLRLGQEHNRLEISVCSQFHLRSSCEMQVVNASIRENGIAVTSDNQSLNPDEYIPTDHGILACTTDTDSPSAANKNTHAWAIQLIAMLAISALAVFSTL